MGDESKTGITLGAISNAQAKGYFEEHSAFRGSFTNAIAARDDFGNCHGVVAFTADGGEFRKEHISTDGSAQIGSLLYGGMVRAAMALGYKTLTL